MNPHANLIIEEGKRLLDAGLSVVPVHHKFPWLSERDGFDTAKTWAEFQNRLITIEEFVELSHDRRSTGICVIGGSVSGGDAGFGVEILDIDYKDGISLWPAFKEKAGSALNGLPFQRTGSRKGFQTIWRCESFSGNQVLARSSGGKTLAETRGEHGLAVVPFSIHPDTHRSYEYVRGHFADVPIISADRRDFILNTMRSLTMQEVEPARKKTPKPFIRPTSQNVEIGAVKEWFNRTMPIEQMLASYGYRIIRNGYAVRPGGNRGTVRIDYENNCSFHNNTNDELYCGSGESGYYVRPLDVLIKLKYRGLGNKEAFMAAIHDAAAHLGVQLVNSPVRDEPPPAPPPPRPRNMGNVRDMPPPATPPPPPQGVVVTNAAAYADFLKNEAGLDPILVEGRPNFSELWKMVRQYTRRFMLMLPPSDGYLERLAADLEARFAVLNQDVEDNVMRLIYLLQKAQVPEYRIKARA